MPFILLAHNLIIITMVCLYIHMMTMHTAPEQFGIKGWMLYNQDRENSCLVEKMAVLTALIQAKQCSAVE